MGRCSRVCLVCLVGGQIVSYVKARAEGLGFTCDVGIAERLERLVLVGIGGLLHGFGVSWGLGARCGCWWWPRSSPWCSGSCTYGGRNHREADITGKQDITGKVEP